MNIAQGMRVVAEYVFRDEQGEILDSSASNGPLTYVHGEGRILRGLEVALEGRAAGDRFSVHLPPEAAFGLHRPELVFEARRENLPADVVLEPGVELFSGTGDRPAFSLRVVQRTDCGALLDGNHPLAGKSLTVDLEILAVDLPGA